jgi:hypothetical protein
MLSRQFQITGRFGEGCHTGDNQQVVRLIALMTFYTYKAKKQGNSCDSLQHMPIRLKDP